MAKEDGDPTRLEILAASLLTGESPSELIGYDSSNHNDIEQVDVIKPKKKKFNYSKAIKRELSHAAVNIMEHFNRD